MARIVLITGGGRSGKSSYARKMAEDLPGPRAFVATCPVLDEEMQDRVREHQKARRRSEWHTIEETIDLAGVLAEAPEYQVVLVDCLTLWINNLMYEAEKAGRQIDEDEIAGRARDLLCACAKRSGTVIFVSNEVGMGIIPENAPARRYRDLAGRCNQVVAAAADVVILVVCGTPLSLKQE